MSAAQLPPGTVIDGRYTLGAALRSRPGAIVHAATDPSGAEAHVTIYGAECFPSALVRERSLRELRQLQSLNAPRVLPVLGCGKLDGGGAFEINAPAGDPALLEGLFARGPWRPADAAAIVVQVGEAVLAAQKVGVLHRNLGPLVIHAGAGGVQLTGFAVGEPQGDAVFGPTETIAPEQVEGKVVDQRTLIFNLAALMQAMLAGASQIPGEGVQAMRAAMTAEPGPDTHPDLRRALSRDPRMRPMMLRQFLGEVAALGGVAAPSAPSMSGASPVAAPAGAKPTSRGWTMFMKDEDAPASPLGGAAGSNSPTPAGGTPAPAGGGPAPAAAPAGAKSSTRGWTMFMQAADDDADAEPETPAAPAAPAKPSTRGWTMFMQAADDDADAEPETPAEPAPEAAKPVAPEPAPDAAKPSTRGWTMFMKDEEAEAPAEAAQPAEPAKPAPASDAVSSAQPSAAAPAAKAKPSTRGWTMFMEAEEAEEAEVTPAEAPATPALAAPGAAAAAPGADPDKSGWTLFKEPAGSVPDVEPAGAPASAPVVQSEPALAEVPAQAPEEDSPPPSKKRGWTMFMEAPISADKPESLGGPKAAAPERATPSTEANQRGWTVFGADKDLAAAKEAIAKVKAGEVAAGGAPAAAGADAPEAGAPTAEGPEPGSTPLRPRSRTVVTPPGVAAEVARPADATMPSPGVADPGSTMPAPGSGALPEGELPDGGAKTVIAAGVAARAGAASGVTSGAEMGPGGVPLGVPDAQSGPIANGAPQSLAPRQSTEIETRGGSNKGLIIGVAAVVVIGAIAAAWAAFG